MTFDKFYIKKYNLTHRKRAHEIREKTTLLERSQKKWLIANLRVK